MYKFTHIIRSFIVVAAMFGMLGVPIIASSQVSAGSSLAEQELCRGAGGVPTNGGCSTPGDNRTVENTIVKITNVLLFIIGALAVIMLIIGGFRYVISGGDQSSISSAKNTILYAVVGLIIAISAYGIVNFVLTSF